MHLLPIFQYVGIVAPPLDTDGDGDPDITDEDDDNDGVLDVDDDCRLEGPNLDGFGCPYTPIADTILAADGLEWAQPGLFNGVSYGELAAAVVDGPADIDRVSAAYAIGRMQTAEAVETLIDLLSHPVEAARRASNYGNSHDHLWNLGCASKDLSNDRVGRPDHRRG